MFDRLLSTLVVFLPNTVLFYFSFSHFLATFYRYLSKNMLNSSTLTWVQFLGTPPTWSKRWVFSLYFSLGKAQILSLLSNVLFCSRANVRFSSFNAGNTELPVCSSELEWLTATGWAAGLTSEKKKNSHQLHHKHNRLATSSRSPLHPLYTSFF